VTACARDRLVCKRIAQGGSTGKFLELVRKTLDEHPSEDAAGSAAASGGAKIVSASSHPDGVPADATGGVSEDHCMSADRPAGAMDLEVLDSFTESTRCELTAATRHLLVLCASVDAIRGKVYVL
jgi:hypothetical protein